MLCFWCVTKRLGSVSPWRKSTNRTWFWGTRSNRPLWNETSWRLQRTRLLSRCSVLSRPGGTSAWWWSMWRVRSALMRHVHTVLQRVFVDPKMCWTNLWHHLQVETAPRCWRILELCQLTWLGCTLQRPSLRWSTCTTTASCTETWNQTSEVKQIFRPFTTVLFGKCWFSRSVFSSRRWDTLNWRTSASQRLVWWVWRRTCMKDT